MATKKELLEEAKLLGIKANAKWTIRELELRIKSAKKLEGKKNSDPTISVKTPQTGNTASHQTTSTISQDKLSTVNTADDLEPDPILYGETTPSGQLIPPKSVPSIDAHNPTSNQLIEYKTKSVLGNVNLSGSCSDQPPHVIVTARAGTGKTTTIITSLKVLRGMDPGITPTTQQQAVWDAVCQSKDAKTICFVAFNKGIAMELQQRVPPGCDAMTMHSMGLKAVTKYFGRINVDSDRVSKMIERLTGVDVRVLRREKMALLKATEELVGLCKQNLISGERDEVSELASYYDVDLGGYDAQVYDYVPQILEMCKRPQDDKCIDFNDMIWLPVVLDLPLFRYDLLLCDEFQDFNRCQQALAKKAGKRIIGVGDPFQSIYGFAGADVESMPRMKKELSEMGGCVELLLTYTRRCGKAIVREAQKLVPDFEAFETNPEGSVRKDTARAKDKEGTCYRDTVQDGDFILCRCNAPLVSECFKFLKMGKKANIQGRDIGKGLIATIKKMKANTIPDLVAKLDDWKHKEEAKELAKRFPSENKLTTIRDKADCLVCFTEGLDSVDAVIAKIESIFTDNRDITGIRLSSIHKAKGLEAKRVYILQGKGRSGPPLEKLNEWERQSELNIRYVAITRAIQELIYVND